MTTASRNAPAEPRWRVIVQELAALLPGYEYGQRFYSIAEICQKFEVSTITARRVLSELQSMGLVEKIQSRGTLVRRPTHATHVRLIMPAGIRSDYATFSAIVRRLIRGINSFAAKHQIDFDTLSESHLQSLFGRRDDGFGFLLLSGFGPQTVRWLRGRHLPFVLLNPHRSFRGLPHARPDRFHAGYVAAKHLIELGHQRIAYVLGNIEQGHFRRRLQGYRHALQEAGLPLSWSLIHQTDGDNPGQDRQAVDELLALRRPPTAIMTGDDSRAIVIIEALRQRGIRVPQDISLLGYPNYPESKLTDPPLSVVDACYEQVAEAAMRLLLEQMLQGADPAQQTAIIQPRLELRGSTGPAPAATRHLPKHLRSRRSPSDIASDPSAPHIKEKR